MFLTIVTCQLTSRTKDLHSQTMNLQINKI